MSKPDPQAFARKMLWHIAGLRAEVRNLHMMFARFLAENSGHDELEVQKKWKKDCDKLQKEIYLQALKDIGVQPEEPPEQDPPWGNN